MTTRMFPVAMRRLTLASIAALAGGLLAPNARAQDSASTRSFVEIGGGWNYTAPPPRGDSYSHGSDFRASIGRELAPHFLLRFDLFRSQLDHGMERQVLAPCFFPGCPAAASFSTETASITGLTANGLLNVDRRGIVYLTAGAGLYQAYVPANEFHFGASAGAGLAVPIGARLRAVVEARYHALVGSTTGPTAIAPITFGFRY